jgi:hypothetical protein
MPVIFFVWCNLFVSKSISDYITDKMIDRIEITDDIFSGDMIPSVIILVILFLMKSLFNSMIYNFLVVLWGIIKNNWTLFSKSLQTLPILLFNYSCLKSIQ